MKKDKNKIKTKYKLNISYSIGVLLLVAQFFSIMYARFIPERFFCWSPYDEHSYMEVSVIINGRELTEPEIRERYHYRAIGWEKRSINNVFYLIKQYETTYGIKDRAKVLVKYTINGHKEEIWNLESELKQ